MVEKNAKDDLRKRSKWRFRVLVFLSLIGAVVLKLSFFFFFIGMLPAMVAYIVDYDKSKYMFSTIAAFNLAGVFPHMMEILMQGGTFSALAAKLSDIFVWFSMYFSAAIGWAFVWFSPSLAAVILDGFYQAKIIHMENQQEDLEQEWGEEVMERKY